MIAPLGLEREEKLMWKNVETRLLGLSDLIQMIFLSCKDLKSDFIFQSIWKFYICLKSPNLCLLVKDVRIKTGKKLYNMFVAFI